MLNEDLIEALRDWSEDYEKAAAWNADHPHHARDRVLIDLCRSAGPVVHVPEMLYRGQGVDDEVLEALLEGREVVIEPTRRDIASWTPSESTARFFAEDAAEMNNASAVVIAMPREHLDVIAHIPRGIGLEEEVLVASRPLLVRPSDVLSAWLYDEHDEVSRPVAELSVAAPRSAP